MIYYIEDYSSIPLDAVKGSFSLSPLENVRLEGKKKKDQSIYVRYAASLGVRQQFGLPLDKIIFDITPDGAPILHNQDNVYLSFTHSNNTVAAAVSSAPIGIDLEYITPYREKILNRYFSAAEKQYVLEHEDKDTAFTQLWCFKESIAKLTGLGLGGVISKTEIFYENGNFISQNYPCSLHCFYLGGKLLCAATELHANTPTLIKL